MRYLCTQLLTHCVDKMDIYSNLWRCLLTILGCLLCTVSAEIVIPVRETEAVTLPCIVQQPNVDSRTVSWFKGNEMVSIGRTVIKFRTSLLVLPAPPPNEWNLRVHRVTKEFEDEYTCKVAGIIQHVVRVVVKAQPEIIDAESSPLLMSVPEYQNVELKCKVTGYPKASISWSRKSRGHGGSIKDLEIATDSMTIVNATRYADDIYICMAENEFGSVQREMSLQITFKPEVMLFQPEAEAKIGEEVTMACIVQSSPLQDAFWSDEDGNHLGTNFKYEVSIESEPVYPVRYMTLTLRTDQWEDADYGSYSCNVSNGTLTSAQQFTLKRPMKTDYSGETVIKYGP